MLLESMQDAMPNETTSLDPEITLILDLDETLALSFMDPYILHDHEVLLDDYGRTIKIYVNFRPWLQYFLENMQKYFRIVVFTASEKDYADPILDLLDPEGKIFAQRLYRDSCQCIAGVYIKDLSALGFDLSKTIIVDNSLHAFALQVPFPAINEHNSYLTEFL